MKNKEHRRDKNEIEVTGVIKNLPDYCMYTQTNPPRPLVKFSLHSFRKQKEEEESVFDVFKVVLFDQEKFYKEYQNDDRVWIKGEIQSRNFARDNYPVDELITNAVQHHIEIWKEFPCSKKPEGNRKATLDWNQLLDKQLIQKVPDDSKFDEHGEKQIAGEYIYRVNEEGVVTKETQHTAYEILVKEIKKIEEPLELEKGDVNKVYLRGRVNGQIYFNLVGEEKPVAFSRINIETKSRLFPEKTFFNHVIFWSTLAEEVFQKAKHNDIIEIIGRFQSREYEKEMTKRWKTPKGKKKKKTKVFTFTTHEISGTKIIIHHKNEEPKA